MTKLIAFYLPQFHEIEENNLWWGKGFTDWTNVKKSRPCYKGHRQPRVPLNDNYYDLSQPRAQEWQSELALKYGMGGFCYYHYWFNGKLLLQTPMENMLKNPNVKIPFCISWANEPWTRTWNGKNNKILIDQEYGNEDDWKRHFVYLLPFFSDNRYIKVDNKPVFLLYRYASMKNGSKMMDFFQRMAKESGFDGLYIISTLCGYNLEGADGAQIDAFAEFEPMYTLVNRSPLFYKLCRHLKRNVLGSILLKMNKFSPTLRNIDYNDFCKIIADSPSYQTDKTVYKGVFTGWDNSPRRGMEGLIMSHETAGKFGCYLGNALDQAMENKHEMVFVNAWNEWAEGAYLEPDKYHRYQYLETVKAQLMQRGLYIGDNK